MEKYKIQKTIGSGSFANVSKALNTKTNEVVAIKKMKKKFSSWDECLNLREIKSLTKLNHPNIMKLKEVIRVNDELFCVFEFCDQNIYQYYLSYKESGQSIPESLIKQILFQTISGLAYMHKHGFFHRDLKPENILYSKGEIKIGDFGLAREIRSRPPYTDYVATRWYRAPEILLKSTNYNSPVDIYAVGCILAELCLLNPLFSGSSEIDQIHKICSVLGTPSQSTWSEGYRLASQIGFTFPHYPPIPLGSIINNASPDAIHLIAGMLSFDPSKRPTAIQILSHPYLNGVAQLFPGIAGNLAVNASNANIVDRKSNNNNPASSNFTSNGLNLNPGNLNPNNINSSFNHLSDDNSIEGEELVLTKSDPFKKAQANKSQEETKGEEKTEGHKEIWRGENEIDFISEDKKKLVITEPFKQLPYSTQNLEPIGTTKPFLIKEKDLLLSKNTLLYDEEVRFEKESNTLNVNSANQNNLNKSRSSSVNANANDEDFGDDDREENDEEEDEIELETQPIFLPAKYPSKPNPNPSTNNNPKPLNLNNYSVFKEKERNFSLERRDKNNPNNKNSSIGREKDKGNDNNMFLPKLNKPLPINQNLPFFENNAKGKNLNYKEKNNLNPMKLPNLPQNGGISIANVNKNQKFMSNNGVNMPSLNSKNHNFSPMKNTNKDEDYIGKYKM